MTEAPKYKHLFAQYLQGTGVDLGCGPEVVVPNAIGMDLPTPEYERYYGKGAKSAATVHGDARRLPFKDRQLDFVFSSHLLEDFSDWPPVLSEWIRVLKTGGHLVILIPEKKRFAAAVVAGQPHNPSHKHEGTVGELSGIVRKLKPSMSIIRESMTDLHPKDYSILFIARRIS